MCRVCCCSRQQVVSCLPSLPTVNIVAKDENELEDKGSEESAPKRPKLSSETHKPVTKVCVCVCTSSICDMLWEWLMPLLYPDPTGDPGWSHPPCHHSCVASRGGVSHSWVRSLYTSMGHTHWSEQEYISEDNSHINKLLITCSSFVLLTEWF